MKVLADYCAPTRLAEALEILDRLGAAARVVAGGTDVMVRLGRGLIPATETTLLSVHRLPELAGVREEAGRIVLGAAVTAAEIVRDPLLREKAPILPAVADRLASAQVREMATIGGNLANASPAGDLINPLLLLDADVVLASAGGERTVPVERLFTGPGATVRRPEELLRCVSFPVPSPGRVFRFEKAGTRPSMECSVVTVGVAFSRRDESLVDVRVAFGSAAPVPLRGREAEAVLEGATLVPDTVERAAQAAAREVSPISDVRGGEAYRRALVAEFVRRLLDG